MKITGHRTRALFERYNFTEQTDRQQAGRQTEEFLAREMAQTTSQEEERPN